MSEPEGGALGVFFRAMTTGRDPTRTDQSLKFGLLAIAVGFALLVVSPAYAAKYAAIVIDGHSGEVLHSSNADASRFPASLTKMMTLYMLFEAIDTGQLSKSTSLTVSRAAQNASPSKLGLARGSTITVEDAIKALVVKSANDVAVVVAEAIGGTESQFAVMMTERARQLGMASTTFRNASGLPNRKQVSTARDMSRLAQALYFSFPHHYHYFALESFGYGGRTYRTHNSVLTDYVGADGLKTGYIRASGYNLVTTAERNGRRLIGVVFGGKTSRSRNAHMVSLLDQSWPMLSALAVPEPTMKPNAVVQIAGLPNLSIGSDIDTIDLAAPAPILTPQPVPAVPSTVDNAPNVVPDSKPDMGLPDPPTEPSFKPDIEALLASIEGQRPPIDTFEPRGDWAIQVGAYYDQQQAREAVATAVAKMPNLAALGEETIVVLNGRKKPIYRARLFGFTEPEARDACGQLKKKKVACIAVKQGPDAILALAE